MVALIFRGAHLSMAFPAFSQHATTQTSHMPVLAAFVPLPEHAAVYSLALCIAVILQEGARYGAFVIHRSVSA